MSNKNQVSRRSTLKYAAFSAAAASTAFAHKIATAQRFDRCTKDVCILGAGASGVFSALKLRDKGLDVVVVERSSRVGGHCETYEDPQTGVAVDIGVRIFPDQPLVRSVFGRYGIDMKPQEGPPSQGGGAAPGIEVDFDTGQLIAAENPTPEQIGQALFTYAAIVDSQFPFINDNGIALPDPVPEELLLPFGAFLENYGLLPGLIPLFNFLQGFGPVLNMTTLYALKNMRPVVTNSIITNSFIVPDANGCEVLYQEASAELGDAVLLNTSPLFIQRRRRGRVQVAVQGPEGPLLIECEKLIVTHPLTGSNMRRFDLDAEEFDVFRRFQSNHYYTSMARVSGLPPFQSVTNRSASMPYNAIQLPGIYGVQPTPAEGLFNILYGGDRFRPDRVIQREIKRDVARLSNAVGNPVCLESFELFKAHNPYALYVTPDEIRQGFYQRLNGLQGHRNTYYLGAAMQTHASFAVWSQADEILDQAFPS